MSAGFFDDFQVDEVLSDSDRTKTMAVLGRWGGKQDKAVVLLSRRPFDKASVQTLLHTSPSSKLQFENDVYAKVCCCFDLLPTANPKLLARRLC